MEGARPLLSDVDLEEIIREKLTFLSSPTSVSSETSLYPFLPPELVADRSFKGALGGLYSIVSTYMDQEERLAVFRAVVVASWAHLHQRRRSGEPYVVHPLMAASILAKMKLDVTTVLASLLHDVVEDTPVGKEMVEELFGEKVSTLVEGVTKLSGIRFKDLEDYQAENLRKMFLVMAKDIRVVLIKLADRLHNMMTIDSLPPEKQRRIARETLEIYAPLAHRLGIYTLKRQLEDLAFRVLEPEVYEDLRKRLRKMLPGRQSVIKEAVSQLSSRLEEEGIRAKISGRVKHYYSVYEKMKRKNLALEQLYDFLALRVIVDSVQECYRVLGIVHSLWHPIPGQFDDYIANPKSNLYQSLHTTVVGPEGSPLEVQIRTWEMHYLAEYGVAAHWRYKSGKRDVESLDEKLSWIRQVIEWGSDIKDSSDFLEHIRLDVLSSEVFVFTPKGDVKLLPRGSCPIDFAYAVHTDVGHHCVGAIVNDKIVPLDYKLQDGDRVKIITSSSGKPSLDWLSIVKTASAKSKIKAYFKRKLREENRERIEKGREILARELSRRGFDPAEHLTSSALSRVARELGFASEEALLLAVSGESVEMASVLSRLVPRVEAAEEEVERIKEQAERERRRASEFSGGLVLVDVEEGVMVRMARCCNPVRGDEVLGYISRGRGIVVHRRDCPNLAKLDPKRMVEAYWKGEEKREDYGLARVSLEALDRPRLLSDISDAVASSEAALVGINAHASSNGRAYVDMVLRVRDLSHLMSVMSKLSSLSSVVNVYRR